MAISPGHRAIPIAARVGFSCSSSPLGREMRAARLLRAAKQHPRPPHTPHSFPASHDMPAPQVSAHGGRHHVDSHALDDVVPRARGPGCCDVGILGGFRARARHGSQRPTRWPSWRRRRDGCFGGCSGGQTRSQSACYGLLTQRQAEAKSTQSSGTRKRGWRALQRRDLGLVEHVRDRLAALGTKVILREAAQQ